MHPFGLALFTAKYFQSKTYYALDEQSLLKTAQIINKTKDWDLVHEREPLVF